MPHILHDCPAMKASDWYPDLAAYLNTETIAINLDAHKEYHSDEGKVTDSGERHCPWCGADIRHEKAAPQEWLDILGAIEGHPPKKIPHLKSHEVLQRKYGKKGGKA